MLTFFIKDFENDQEMIFIFYKPCSGGHLQGVPCLYLGLGEYIHVYFKYICIYRAKPIFLGTGHQLMTRS